MTAGLPGVGLGGIFYLLCALIMPFVELINTALGRTSKERWRLVVGQFSLLCLILAGCWATGLFLVFIFKKIAPVSLLPLAAMTHRNIFQLQPFCISLVLLTVVFLILHVTNHIQKRK